MDEELRRVLVVDPSKVVRTALRKRLQDHFDVREEADGESAWQTLVIDSSIVAIVCASQLPKLGGLPLLDRIRVAKLRRICDIPFLLLVSGSESEDDRQKAKERGATGFVHRGMSKEEILECVWQHVNWEFATNLTDSEIVPAAVQVNRPLQHGVGNDRRTPLSHDEVQGLIEAGLAGAAAREGMLGIICFGLDDAGSLSGLHGQRALLTISRRLSKILQAKVGSEDSVGIDDHGRCIIVAPGSSLVSCQAFAQRVCRGLAKSHITIGGAPLNFKVSAGIVAIPADAGHGSSAADLLSLATDRLLRAQAAGGNRVVSGDTTDLGFVLTPDYLFNLSRFCAPTPEKTLIGSLGLQLMPLLRALDKSMEFGLPLDELERRFSERAKSERQG